MTTSNAFNTGTITRFRIEEQRRLNAAAGISVPTGSFTALVNDVRLA